MAVISGMTTTRGTLATNPSAQIIPNIADRLFRRGAKDAPFLRVLNMMKKKSYTDRQFTILQDARMDNTITTNGGTLTSVATDLTMTSTSVVRPWDLWKNERSKEVIFVTTVQDSTSLNPVIRGYGTTSAAAITDGDTWRFVGNSLAAGSTAPESRQTVVTTLTNYLQDFSWTTYLDDIQDVTGLYGEGEQQRQKTNTRFNFLRGVESAFLFGEPKADVYGSADDSNLTTQRYDTGGLEYWIQADETANADGIILDAGGVLTEDLFWDLIGVINKNDPEDMGDGMLGKLMLASDKVVKHINKWHMQKLQTEIGAKEFGSNVTQYKSPFGKLTVMRHYLLDGDEYGDYAFIVNPNYLHYAYLNQKDMYVKTNIQDNDEHSLKSEIRGVIGLGIQLVGAHGMIKNATYTG